MIRTAVGRGCLWMALLVCCHAAMALDPHRALDQYSHQLWQTDSGLPQNTIHSILQTRDGYLWLGTEGGLVRFDGIAFVTFDTENTPQLKSDIIYDLFEDRSGSLWISTASGLERYQAGTFTPYTMASGLPADTVWFTFEDHKGRIWAITAGGPAYLAGDHFQTLPDAQAAAPEKRRALTEDAQGRLWIGGSSGLFAVDADTATPHLEFELLKGIAIEALALDGAGNLWIGSQQGLERYSQGSLVRVPIAKLPANTEVTSLIRDTHNSLWVGTAQGLARVTGGTATAFEIKGAGKDAVPVQRVEKLFEDRQGAVWIAGVRGAARLFNNKLEFFDLGSRLATDNVLSIFEDREGDVWIGTDSSGLNVLRDRKFTAYTTGSGLSGDDIRCVFENAAGDIWIGTNGAGLNHRTAHGFVTLTTRNGLSSNIILSLAGSPQGGLWVGTPDGLNRLHQGRVDKFTSADGLPDDFIRSLYTDNDGTLWIGTRHGLAHLDGRRFTSYSSMDGLGSDFVGAILRARGSDLHGGLKGDLWIGTSGGLTRLHNGVFTNYTVKNGLSDSIVTAIYQDKEGTIWLGTNGGGLNRLRLKKNGDPAIKPFPSGSEGLPRTIYGILEDAGGNLWLSSRTGVFRVSTASLNAFADDGAHSIPVSAYGTADGMTIRECSEGHPAAWRMTDGSLWFATREGVNLIDPAHTEANRLPPPVVIEAFLIDDQVHATEREIAVRPGARRLEFHYAGLSFVAPQKVRYRYKLAGFDHAWIDAGTRRAAFYTNLPPGKYRFQVLAANNDGVWNQSGASLEFRMEPHFYQTYWFYAVLALASLLLAWLIYRWRVRQVESAWSAVVAERSRLAREIHDTLAQGFVGISVQLELVARLLSTSQEAARQQLDQTRALVRSSLAEARASIWQLRSPGASRDDLPARLTSFLNGRIGSSPAKVYFQVKGAYHPLPQTVEDELLRIGQEAVSNAVRHAGATRIDVELIYEEARVRLNVNDDGCGFPTDSTIPGGHFGIQGMRERAQQIDAVLALASVPGEGTRVSVTAPLS